MLMISLLVEIWVCLVFHGLSSGEPTTSVLRSECTSYDVIVQDIMQHKLVLIETPDVVETTLALDNYRKACDCGRGAIFFSVARFVLLTASLRPPFKIHYQSAAEPMIGMVETFAAFFF